MILGREGNTSCLTKSHQVSYFLTNQVSGDPQLGGRSHLTNSSTKPRNLKSEYFLRQKRREKSAQIRKKRGLHINEDDFTGFQIPVKGKQHELQVWSMMNLDYLTFE